MSDDSTWQALQACRDSHHTLNLELGEANDKLAAKDARIAELEGLLRECRQKMNDAGTEEAEREGYWEEISNLLARIDAAVPSPAALPVDAASAPEAWSSDYAAGYARAKRDHDRIAELEAALGRRDALLREVLAKCENGFPDYCIGSGLESAIEAELSGVPAGELSPEQERPPYDLWTDEHGTVRRVPYRTRAYDHD